MISQNFTLTRGDTLEFTITIEDTQTEPDEITFTVVDSTVKKTPVIIKKLSEEEIVKTEDEGLVYRVFIETEDTDYLKLLNYYYQIELQFSDTVETVAEGKFVITPEV